MSNDSSVTLCMITKNEEEYITCCINSVRHLIDEVIVVDTGSTDSTIVRALQAGAKVYHYNWQQNFAEARNYALDQAAGDWILVLDADEMLEYVDAAKFNNLLNNSQVEGYFIDIESYIGSGEEKIFDQVVRLFRNKSNYRFSGAIHEQVVGSIKISNQGNGLACTELKIIHRGYLNETIQGKNKHTRNMTVIKKALIDNPDDPFLRYSLGIEYMQQGNLAQSNEQFARALEKLTGEEGYFHSVVVNLASGLVQTGQLQQGEEFIDKAIMMLPQDNDLMLLKGMLEIYNGDYKSAITYLQQPMDNYKDNAMLSFIHTLRGDLYAMLQYDDKAEVEYFTSLQLVPEKMYPLLQIIGLKQKGISQLTWYEISKFTSSKINKNLQLHLIKLEEFAVVLVLALFNIMNQNSQSKMDFIAACNDYLQVVMCYQPVDELSKTVIDYLRYSGEMLLLYGTTTIITSLSIAEPIEKIIYDNLNLIIKTLCPTWIPCIKLTEIIYSAGKEENTLT